MSLLSERIGAGKSAPLDSEANRAADRDWFKLHPDRHYRVRFASMAEILKAMAQQPGEMPDPELIALMVVKRERGECYRRMRWVARLAQAIDWSLAPEAVALDVYKGGLTSTPSDVAEGWEGLGVMIFDRDNKLIDPSLSQAWLWDEINRLHSGLFAARASEHQSNPKLAMALALAEAGGAVVRVDPATNLPIPRDE